MASDSVKGTIIKFKGVHDYCNYWDKICEKAKADTQRSRYGSYIKSRPNSVNNSLRAGATASNIIAYGEPLPTDYEEAMARKYFMNMPLYNMAYLELSPYLNMLEKVSQGIIPKEVIKPTDKEIGVFSFERAMMQVDGTPALYSKKHDRYFGLGEGVEVFDADKKQKTNKEGQLLFKLNLDGSEAVLTILEEDGAKQFNSSNKKSFLFKEKLPRPNRAVRLFILVGQNWGEKTYWAGVTAVICANFLESVGYSVRLTACIGLSNSNLKFDGSRQYGHRFNIMDVKDYTETMDSLSLLYVLADPSFFRIRQFSYYMAQQYLFDDEYDTSLGSMPSKQTFEKTLYQEQKKGNLETEKDTLYYFLGGSEIKSIEDSKNELKRIICNAETKNKEILAKMGYEFLPPDPSEEPKREDIDCSKYR